MLTKSKGIVVPKQYNLEKIAQKFSAEKGKDIHILRLPIDHSELNPIELVWAQVKSEAARKNVTFKIKDVQILVNQALENVTPAKWAKVEKHSIRVEKEFWKIDSNGRDITERFIIDLSDDSDTELDFVNGRILH